MTTFNNINKHKNAKEVFVGELDIETFKVVEYPRICKIHKSFLHYVKAALLSKRRAYTQKDLDKATHFFRSYPAMRVLMDGLSHGDRIKDIGFSLYEAYLVPEYQ